MRKGISEIISSVLLLAIAVSIAGVYSQWAPQFATNTTQEVANNADNQMKCSNAAFDISNPLYDMTGQVIRFEISNKGTINFNNDITVTAVNDSQITVQKTIGSLEVEESQTTSIETQIIPETIVASSQECPGLRIVEENIKIQK